MALSHVTRQSLSAPEIHTGCFAFTRQALVASVGSINNCYLAVKLSPTSYLNNEVISLLVVPAQQSLSYFVRELSYSNFPFSLLQLLHQV